MAAWLHDWKLKVQLETHLPVSAPPNLYCNDLLFFQTYSVRYITNIEFCMSVGLDGRTVFNSVVFNTDSNPIHFFKVSNYPHMVCSLPVLCVCWKKNLVFVHSNGSVNGEIRKVAQTVSTQDYARHCVINFTNSSHLGFPFNPLTLFLFFLFLTHIIFYIPSYKTFYFIILPIVYTVVQFPVKQKRGVQWKTRSWASACRHQPCLCWVWSVLHSFPPCMGNTVWIANGSWEGRSEAKGLASGWWKEKRNQSCRECRGSEDIGPAKNVQPPTTAHMWSIHGDGKCTEQTEAVNWLNVNINIVSCLARWTVWEIRLFFLPFFDMKSFDMAYSWGLWVGEGRCMY